MDDDQKLERDVEQRDENKYEAPKLEVIGTVDQLTSEFDDVGSATDGRQG